MTMNELFYERQAQKIISDYNLVYPFDPSSFCIRLGFTLADSFDLENDGYYINQNFKRYIICSTRVKGNHKKFVIAHELGHYFLHGETTLQICSGIVNAFYRENVILQTEKEANTFASELLLPSSSVAAALPRRKSFHFSDLRKLSNEYKVSFTMTALKAVKKSHTQNELLLCYRSGNLDWYAAANPDFEYRQLDRTIPPGSMADDLSNLTAKLNLTNHKITKGIWAYSSEEICEECLTIHPNVILVLLSF